MSIGSGRTLGSVLAAHSGFTIDCSLCLVLQVVPPADDAVMADQQLAPSGHIATRGRALEPILRRVEEDEIIHDASCSLPNESLMRCALAPLPPNVSLF